MHAMDPRKPEEGEGSADNGKAGEQAGSSCSTPVKEGAPARERPSSSATPRRTKSRCALICADVCDY